MTASLPALLVDGSIGEQQMIVVRGSGLHDIDGDRIRYQDAVDSRSGRQRIRTIENFGQMIDSIGVSSSRAQGE